MKKMKYIIFMFAFMLFMPLTVCKAADSYVSSVIHSNGSTTKIGDYTDYTKAKNAAIDYKSNSSSVAVVYRNNKIVYARYGIVRFKSGNVVNLYPDGITSTAYTSTHSSYGTEAAFIDYDSTTNRSKIKISGYTGYVDTNLLDIVPISNLTSNSVKILATISLNVRTGPGTSYSVIGSVSQGQVYSYSQKKSDGLYTWYNINYNGTSAWIASADSTWTTEVVASNLETYYENYSTGNVIHYYKYASGQGFTNLGTSPSYLKQGTSYYSFDGNYFYTNLVDMLDDYRNNGVTKAINSNNPFYSYYMYLPNHSMTKYTADDFNQVIISKGYNSKSESVMYGEGSSFIASQEKYGVNAMLTFAAALNESASGTSWIAKNKNNLFGHGAYDSCPTECATTYATVADSILAHAKMTGQGYNDPSDWRYYGSHYGNKASGMNVKYATDPYWGEKAASNAFNNDKKFGSQDFKSNTIGVKRTSSSVPVRKEPKESSSVIYNLKNNSYNVEKIPLIVFDKVNANGYDWYKVYTDIALDANQNKASGDYKFATSYGYVRADYLYVENNQPSITAIDIEVDINSKLDLLKGVTASDKEDGNLTNRIEVTDNVDITKPGTYQATYTVEDNSRFSVSKTVKVTVKGVPEPTINASDIEIPQYTSFNPKEYANAVDPVEGNITDKIIVVEDNVKPDVIGEYEVTYSVTNNYQKTVTKTIKVNVVKNAEPVIVANDRNILLNSTFNPKEGVTAIDKEDGNLTSSIIVVKDNVNSQELGTYQVTYQVTDNANQTVTKTINVTVVEKTLTKKDGRFYFEYLKKVNNKLQLKGYQTIEGIDNDLATNINYKIIFENIETNEQIVKTGTRIKDESEISMPIYSFDGKDYSYAWFKIDFDFNDIPQANYRLYIVAESDNYYSRAVISNKMFNSQATYYEDDKSVIIRNNYSDNSAPVELIVRDEKLAERNSVYTYNQFDQYLTFELSDENLKIKGTSYSYGADLGLNKTVKRQLIFENLDTYSRYVYNIGSITNGLYNVVLPVSDGLSKTRAWYDASVDISLIPKGRYVIYVVNNSNIEDVAEFKDLLNRDLSSITGTIKSKKYSFKINTDRGNRIEMIVK